MGGEGSGYPRDGREPPAPPSWCQATLCDARVEAGKLLCARHARHVPDELRKHLERIDPRCVLDATLNLDTLNRLEVIATVIEAVDRAMGRAVPPVNPYRYRLERHRDALRAGARQPGRGKGVAG